MSTYIYDDAIIDDLRRLTGDERISIQPVNNVFRTVARMNNDDIVMPLISLTRTGWSLISGRKNHMMKFDGTWAEYNPREDRYARLQAMPIRISYQLDVWTKTRKENDEILREIIWYYSTHPTLHVTIPYGLNVDHVFNIFIDEDVEDNSDIVEHQNRGEYFRQTISIYTDDAYLWKSSSRGPTTVETYVDTDSYTDIE